MNSESQTISLDQIRTVAAENPAPFYVYSRTALAERAKVLTDLHLPFGLTMRGCVSTPAPATKPQTS